jgi:hypothetical protein
MASATVPVTALVAGQKYLVTRVGAEDKPLLEGTFTNTMPQPERGRVMVMFSNVRMRAGPEGGRQRSVYGFVFDTARPAFDFYPMPTGGRRRRTTRRERRRRATRRN